MAHIAKNSLNSGLLTTVISDVIIHVFFYWTRILMFVAVRIITFTNPRRIELPNAKANDFFLITVINFFLFFLVLCSVITGDIFKY
jgi:hypothetical protein